jgi:hypothetical protein
LHDLLARALLLHESRKPHVKPTHADAEVEAIAHELEQYISLHATAADTPEGIARWWLDRAEQPALTRVEAALELLVERGVLARRPLPDGKHIYARAPRPGTRRPSTN